MHCLPDTRIKVQSGSNLVFVELKCHVRTQASTSAPAARKASKFFGCPTHAAFAQTALLFQAGSKTKTLALHLGSVLRGFSCFIMSKLFDALHNLINEHKLNASANLIDRVLGHDE